MICVRCERRPETSDLTPDRYYLHQTALGWYPPKHQNHVSIVSHWYGNVVRLRDPTIDGVDFAFRVLRDLHRSYSAVHSSDCLGGQITSRTSEAWAMLSLVC